MAKLLLVYDAEGAGLDNILPYKVAILVSRNFSKDDEAIDGSWKMNVFQQTRVMGLYTGILIQELKQDGVPPPTFSKMPMKYGGYEIDLDRDVPDGEVWFVYQGNVRLKVVGLPDTAPDFLKE